MRKIWSGIILHENRMLLIKRSRNKKENPNLWAFPGWGNENDEMMEETVIRELKEEVGLDFSVIELFHENKTETHHFFRYMGTWIWKIIIEESESGGYGWFSSEKALQIPISTNMKELWDKLHHEKYI